MCPVDLHSASRRVIELDPDTPASPSLIPARCDKGHAHDVASDGTRLYTTRAAATPDAGKDAMSPSHLDAVAAPTASVGRSRVCVTAATAVDVTAAAAAPAAAAPAAAALAAIAHALLLLPSPGLLLSLAYVTAAASAAMHVLTSQRNRLSVNFDRGRWTPPCYAVSQIIKRRVRITGKAGYCQRVSVAGLHGPAEPALCRKW